MDKLIVSKAKVLFIHGFMGSALNWGRIRNLLEVLRPGTQTFAIDLLGHAARHPTGEQSRADSAHRVLTETLEEDISQFKPSHVVAHSFGLRPSLLLGQKNPKLIPHLIVEDSSPELNEAAFQYLMKILKAPTPFANRDLAKAYFESVFGVQTAISRFLLSNIRSREDSSSDWRFDCPFLERLLKEALENSLWEEWKNFPGKMDLIYGTKSELFKLKEMTEARPELRIYPIEDAGHWVHSDQSEAFVQTLNEIIGT